MKDRYECCGDSDCSCAQCAAKRIERTEERGKGLVWQMLEVWATVTAIFFLLVFVTLVVTGVGDTWAWLMTPVVAGFKLWMALAAIYASLLTCPLLGVFQDHAKGVRK